MKSLISTSIAACLALSAGLALAQADKTAMKKDMAATQDCKEHTNEMKGQKRTDPSTAETSAKCGDMKNGSMKNGKMGTDNMKSSSGPSVGTSGTTPATGTGTTSGTSSGATGTGPSTPTK